MTIDQPFTVVISNDRHEHFQRICSCFMTDFQYWRIRCQLFGDPQVSTFVSYLHDSWFICCKLPDHIAKLRWQLRKKGRRLRHDDILVFGTSIQAAHLTRFVNRKIMSSRFNHLPRHDLLFVVYIDLARCRCHDVVLRQSVCCVGRTCEVHPEDIRSNFVDFLVASSVKNSQTWLFYGRLENAKTL